MLKSISLFKSSVAWLLPGLGEERTRLRLPHGESWATLTHTTPSSGHVTIVTLGDISVRRRDYRHIELLIIDIFNDLDKRVFKI